MCQAGEDCLQDGDMMTPATWAVCSQPGCMTEADCTFAPPSTGAAPVTCGDPTDGMGMPPDRCYLDCAAGQTCPDGMSCRNDSWCAWDAPSDTLLFDDFQTGDFSMGWTLNDVDGNTSFADPSVDYVTDAWVVSDFIDGGAGSNLSAHSTSYYSPAAASDDWLISPQIMLGPNTRVYWYSQSFSGAFPDGFELRISTAGTAVADFEANPELFSLAGEDTSYVLHIVDIAAAGYADQSVYLAWRNTTFDGWLLAVDNVAVADFP
ncbi:MAG: choice-of-anchor J domain-containing protein [Nannocystaceae bacterium]